MRRRPAALCALAAAVLSAAPAAAHFLQLIPEADVLPEGGDARLAITFTHPFEGGPAMAMTRPVRFGAVIGGETLDLSAALASATVDGAQAWTAAHALAEPGAAVFFVEPAPYWEPAEGKFIVQHAKVVVDAWASGEGWTAATGAPVEIEPLVRPGGIWTGNLFRGVVRAGGAPLPFAEIEVAHVNETGLAAPNDLFAPQVIRAGADGEFAYAIPRAGWWGFAALTEAPEPMAAPDGRAVPVEVGGVIWVRARDMTPERGAE